MRHHDLDVKPIPAKPIYINECWIGDVATNTGITGMVITRLPYKEIMSDEYKTGPAFLLRIA